MQFAGIDLSTALAYSPVMPSPPLALSNLIRAEILANNGFLPFERYMHLALYAPGLGYYAREIPMGSGEGSARQSSDFVTAPELTPLFGQTVARQIAQLFAQGIAPQILEFGAGTGKLARDILQALAQLGFTQVQYQILEVSSRLRHTQQSLLQPLGLQVQWLDTLPVTFEGIMLGNEVLDAMPVSVFTLRNHTLYERGVGLEQDALVWKEKKADKKSFTAISMRLSEQKWFKNRIEIADKENFSAQAVISDTPYVSEIAWQAQAFVQTISTILRKGALLFIDYGFPAAEFYHWQRNTGTLMCFTHHRTHSDVLHAPGQQDITAHVDFSAIAQAAAQGGAQLAGYVSQARFLMNSGLLELAAALPQEDRVAYARAIAPVQKLLSEAEMGELFKVIAFIKGIDVSLLGFERGDRSGTL